MTAGRGGEGVRVRFAHDVFDLDAVKRAAYRMSDRISVEIDVPAGEITCDLISRSPKHDIVALEAEFRQHVLDYDLRARIATETEAVRNLILSLAFSKTGV